MKYHISHNNQPFGPFSEQEIRDALKLNKFQLTDHVWAEGMDEWQPIYKVFSITLPPTLPPPPPLPRPTIVVESPTVMHPVLYEPPLPRRSPGFWEKFQQGTPPQPAIHVNIKKHGCGSGCATVFVICLVLIVLVAIFQEKKPGLADKPSPPGNLAIIQQEKSTTANKTALLGKTYLFRCIVHDVQTDRNLIVQVDTGNYCNVTFASPTPQLLNLRKGQIIQFSATLRSFGTGILTHHQLDNANLSSIEN